MIFQQYTQILSGAKTETRRIKPIRHAVGSTVAIVPKRAKPAWWFLATENMGVIRIDGPREYAAFFLWKPYNQVTSQQANKYLANMGAIQARITIIRKRMEHLQDIDFTGAVTEGVGSVDEYRDLWNNINDAPGKRWADNPMIEVVTFGVSPVLQDLYTRWTVQQEVEVTP